MPSKDSAGSKKTGQSKRVATRAKTRSRTTRSAAAGETTPSASESATAAAAIATAAVESATRPPAEGRRRVSAEQRRAMIAEAAYLRALARGFNGGDADSDWLEAERQVDELLGSPAS